MFEKISLIRSNTLPEQQSCLRKRIKSRLKLFVILERYCRQEGMRELAPYRCTDLSYFLG
jgi:hypothetical protein